MATDVPAGLSARLEKVLAAMEQDVTRDVRQERRQYMIDVVTLYFIFPTLLVGMYGMNINLPFMRKPWMFNVILAAIVAWVIFVYVFVHSEIEPGSRAPRGHGPVAAFTRAPSPCRPAR